jgi:hypothetical protein
MEESATKTNLANKPQSDQIDNEAAGNGLAGVFSG